MKNIFKKLKERWYVINSIWKAEEYFVAIANKKGNYKNKDFAPILYEYMNNTKRELFYTFIHDYIENNLRSISGKFICVRSYEDIEHDIFIMKGSEVTFEKGYCNVISAGSVFSYKMPTEEIFSHFKFISK